jgi:uncharacterized membrane protein
MAIGTMMTRTSGYRKAVWRRTLTGPRRHAITAYPAADVLLIVISATRLTMQTNVR